MENRTYSKHKWTYMEDHAGVSYKIDLNKVTFIKILADDDHKYHFDNGTAINFKINVEEKIGLTQ